MAVTLAFLLWEYGLGLCSQGNILDGALRVPDILGKKYLVEEKYRLHLGDKENTCYVVLRGREQVGGGAGKRSRNNYGAGD